MNAQHFVVRNAEGGGGTMAEIFARTSDHSSNGDLDLLRRPGTPMTDAELLQHYIERERIIHAGQRNTSGRTRPCGASLPTDSPAATSTRPAGGVPTATQQLGQNDLEVFRAGPRNEADTSNIERPRVDGGTRHPPPVFVPASDGLVLALRFAQVALTQALGTYWALFR